MAEREIFPPRNPSGSRISSMDQYTEMWQYSIENNEAFWREKAHELLDWFQDFDRVHHGSFEDGDIAWFTNGKLNVSTNCLDRHINSRGDQIAIIWEADEPGEGKTFTYRQVLQETCRIANVLKEQGVRRSDSVAVYMPMIPEAAFVMLACARLGAPHSLVFAGFSAQALRERIIDANCKWVITADEGIRGGKIIPLKRITDEAVLGLDSLVQKVFVFNRTGAHIQVNPHDVLMEEHVKNARPYCPAEEMDSEDTLFYLYTSGSTGKPKGLAHTTAGYLLYTTLTHRYVFDIREGDIYACVADVGWITGHSYIVYGPLSNGATTLMFESTPLYPDASRYWDMVERHKITQFYTAPTAIRALMKYGEDPVKKHDRSSLRILGTVGEPINPEAWRWYYNVVGEQQCDIVDTWWQTETGGIMCTPLPECTPTKPGSATLPFFGIELAILDPQSGEELQGNGVEGVLAVKRPWPSITRTVFGCHERYMNGYMRPYSGYYFTGDGCRRDEDGYYWITGRVDDVMNVSGHRIGTAEIESALVGHVSCAEAAVVQMPHDIKGHGIACFVILRSGYKESVELVGELRQQVRHDIGPFATPDLIIIAPGLPKTRSGKIMRRILRKLVEGSTLNDLGDVSTLADPSVVDLLFEKVQSLLQSN